MIRKGSKSDFCRNRIFFINSNHTYSKKYERIRNEKEKHQILDSNIYNSDK